MNGNSILLGRVFGIPIRAHFLLLIALPFIMNWFSSPSVPMRLLGAIGLFASVALHELGHSVVAQAKGSHIQEIVLYPFGGAAKISNIPVKPLDEILVALAGPAVSLIIGIIGTILGLRIYYANPELDYTPLILELGGINIVLFVFNLFPVFPMDGGRVLRATLATKKSRVEATRIAATIGKYFCIFFVVYGLLKMNFFLAFIGGYIYFAGQAEYRQVVLAHQATHFSGFREGKIEVDVSPPPYAAGGGSHSDPLIERLRKLFRR
jgi:Zn-dependent protease